MIAIHNMSTLLWIVSKAHTNATQRHLPCAAQHALAADLAFGQSFRWFAFRLAYKYTEPSPAQPARQLKRKPLGNRRTKEAFIRKEATD
jgi:hypothetical protein